MSSDRIKFIVQKRTSLKSALTQLQNLLDKENPDEFNAESRLARIADLMQAYEGFHDEWTLLDPQDERLVEFFDIQDRYHNLASKVKRLINDKTSELSQDTTLNTTINSVSESNEKSNIRLPTADVPKFHGTYETWLTFKNTFLTMIDARKDLSDVEKFLYLKSALKGEALSKIAIFTASSENYKKAWEYLQTSYEIKKIIVSRHLSGILNLPVVEKATHDNLMKLVDDANQHVSALSTLKINIGTEMLAQIIESKLPRTLTDKWDETVQENEIPQFGNLCKFLTATAARLSKRQGPPVELGKRDHFNKRSFSGKRFKLDENQKVFVTQTSNNCIVCKTQWHPLYKCEAFLKLTVPQRIDIVKKANLCTNCMRKHRGACQSSKCTICFKYHNTLLHILRSEENNSNINNSNDSHVQTFENKISNKSK